MNQRQSNPLFTQCAVSGGRDVGEERKGQEVSTGPGGVYTTYGEDWGCDDADGCGDEHNGDTLGREVVV